jgi:PPOX class probable F420-dependent enzyme
MSVQLEPKFSERLGDAYHIWLTTVREDGMPQPTPVWFIYDGDTFLIYSQPDAQKVKNIRANPHVALSYTDDPEAERYLVIMGEAAIDEASPKAIDNPPYLAKYGPGIPAINMTAESMSAMFSLPIRITPTRVRGG